MVCGTYVGHFGSVLHCCVLSMVAQVFWQLDLVERADSSAMLSLARRPHHSCMPQSCLITDRFPCNLKVLASGSNGWRRLPIFWVPSRASELSLSKQGRIFQLISCSLALDVTSSLVWGFIFFHALHLVTSRISYTSCQFLWETVDVSQSSEPAAGLGQVI